VEKALGSQRPLIRSDGLYIEWRAKPEDDNSCRSTTTRVTTADASKFTEKKSDGGEKQG
jgi:hypothetical protein